MKISVIWFFILLVGLLLPVSTVAQNNKWTTVEPKRLIIVETPSVANPLKNSNDSRTVDRGSVTSKSKDTQDLEIMRRDFFFDNGRWDDDPRFSDMIQDIVKFMKKYPKVRLTMTGFDSQADCNPNSDIISKKRTETIRDQMLKFGISEKRIFHEWRGAKVQPYSEADKNNVVICICAE